jgi:hypothetical protein
VSEETRKNLLALGIVFVPLLVVGAFVLWPTPILGVSESELSDDLTREYTDPGSGVSRIDCRESGDLYECSDDASDDEPMVVEVDWTGVLGGAGREWLRDLVRLT